MARRPVGFAGGRRGGEAGTEVGKRGRGQRVSGGAGGKNAERMREIRIYTLRAAFYAIDAARV